MNQKDSDIPIVLPNSPRHLEGYREFRRRILHLSALHQQHELHLDPLLYEEIWPLAPEHPLTPQALNQGYRWSQAGPDQKPLLTRQVTGRLAITNYDVARHLNEERRRLHDEAERYPRDQVLVDIRPGFPGGDCPLHGRVQLRSFEAMLRFLAGSPDELPEFDVEPDTRTGPMPGNPPRTLELFETAAPPRDAAVAVEFEGRWYSIRKATEDTQRSQGWNLMVFRVLNHIFQLTVADISQKPTFPIAIAK